MGMSKLNEIVAIFQKRPKERHPLRLFKTEPPRGKIGLGTINSIEQVVFEQKLSSPAIVIGEVVRDCKKRSFYEELKSIAKQVVYGKE
jgi:uroporphyrin-III C-methyltransferase